MVSHLVSVWMLIAVALVVGVGSTPAQAIFLRTAAERVEEVPVDRVLANLERNAQRLSRPEQARALGRVHLLAYLRGTSTLPVYRDLPYRVVEETIDDCASLDPAPSPSGATTQELCAAPRTSLGPPGEIPEVRPGRSRGAVEHLRAAIAAYTEARTLDPLNLRTRLALAFAFDQSGEQAVALDELRFVANEGLRRTQPPAAGRMSIDWELHVVLSEAQEHLSRLAATGADRRLAQLLKVRLDAAPPAIAITPILVPLASHTGIEPLVDRRSPVAFDFSGQGLPMRSGWITSRAAWLVWDPDRRGQITGGFQLFGSVTWMMFWTNGYQALGALDDDADGRIGDRELEGLALWQDLDADGVSDPGEIQPLSAFGIVSLGYAHERSSDELWVSPDGVSFRDGRTLPTYDWLLRVPAARRPSH